MASASSSSSSSSSSAAAAAPAPVRSDGSLNENGVFPAAAPAPAAAAAADTRETQQGREIAALRLIIDNDTRHPTLHTIMTHYDILKDAAVPPGITGTGKALLTKALSKIITKPARDHINRYKNPLLAPPGEPNRKSASADFFQTLDLAINQTRYKSIVKKIGRIQNVVGRPQNKLPSFITMAIEESGISPNKFISEKDQSKMPSYISLASYIDPFTRSQTEKTFSYDDSKAPKVLLGAGKTVVNQKELESIGIHGIKWIEGKINGSTWECETEVKFDQPGLHLKNRFSKKFVETGEYGNDYARYWAGNATKNTWFKTPIGTARDNTAIKFILCKEMGDSLQVFLGNKLKESLPKEHHKSVCIFSCDKVVGMRARLLRLNALIKNYDSDEEGALFDECNLYLSEEEKPEEIYQSLIISIYEEVINYNNDVIRNIRGAIEEGFTIPSFDTPISVPKNVSDYLKLIIDSIMRVNDALIQRREYIKSRPASEIYAEFNSPIAAPEGEGEVEEEEEEEGAGAGAGAGAAILPDYINLFTRDTLIIANTRPLPVNRIDEFEQIIKQCKAIHMFRIHEKTHKYICLIKQPYIFFNVFLNLEGRKNFIDIILKNLFTTDKEQKREAEKTRRATERAAAVAARDATRAAARAGGESGADAGDEGRAAGEGEGLSGGGEHWESPNEIEGVFNQYFENKDLFEMIHNPNKLLKEKIWEYYGTKGDDYCYSMMNSMYYFFDSINTTSIDKEILNWFNIHDDQYIIFNIGNLNAFKELYNSVKNIRINGLPKDLLQTIALRTIGLSNVNHLTDSQQEAKIREQESLERRQVASPELEEEASGRRSSGSKRFRAEQALAAVAGTGLTSVTPFGSAAQAQAHRTSPAQLVGTPLSTVLEENPHRQAALAAPQALAAPRQALKGPQAPVAPPSASSQATRYSLSGAESRSGSGSESVVGPSTLFKPTGAVKARGGTRRQNLRYRKTRKNHKE